METCARCGHQLGIGRYCVNCGHPVGEDWRTDTAERPAVVDPTAPGGDTPRVPPPVLAPPPEPRFPLYADQLGRPGPLPSGPPPAGPPPQVVGAGGEPTGGHRAGASGRPAWLPWLLVAAAVVLTATLGGVLLLVGSGDEEAATDPAPTAGRSTGQSASPSSGASADPTPEETSATTGSTESTAPTGEATDVASLATAAVPATAPPNLDVDGNQVRYEARNMLDGVPTTCWRREGDGTGDTVTVTLEAPTTLTSVGMINGYAKTSTDGRNTLDWYRGNRRVLEVEWAFDDGTTVVQSLTETRKMQTIEVDPVTTSTVTLRLVEVSAPGTGRSARNYTAISDLALVGTPA